MHTHAAGLVGAEVYITGTGSETLAGNVITLGPEVYVSDVTISESLVGVLTTVVRGCEAGRAGARVYASSCAYVCDPNASHNRLAATSHPRAT